jgi:hypothetical protein
VCTFGAPNREVARCVGRESVVVDEVKSLSNKPMFTVVPDFLPSESMFVSGEDIDSVAPYGRLWKHCDACDGIANCNFSTLSKLTDGSRKIPLLAIYCR